MYSKNDRDVDHIYARLDSTDWGIWGKEKYTFSEKKQNEKHARELSVLKEIVSGSPDRLKLALRYTYGICDLKAFALPLSKSEFQYLSGIYSDAKTYSDQISDESFKELVQELYCMNKTASEIPGFTAGELVNETNKPGIWRKYFFLDFFKFSGINILMRETNNQIIHYSHKILTSKLVLSWFLGVGSFVEKASFLFTDESFQIIKNTLNKLCKKIELYPEFPDILFQNYSQDYEELLNYIKENRKSVTCDTINTSLINKRDTIFNLCNQYYKKYYELNYSGYKFLLNTKKPLKQLIKLYNTVLKSDSIKTDEVKYALRAIRSVIDDDYYHDSLIDEELTIKNYIIKTNHPYFQGLLYEGKILGILFQLDHPEYGSYFNSIFNELVPFYSYYYKKNNQLFTFNTELSHGLPRMVVAHHLHNADCKKLRDKMIINKLLIWDPENISFNISSSSSKIDIILNERECCLELGYNHYRIHARQHLKAGNQNRAIPNAIDGVGREYYLTLDDDYFLFPEYAVSVNKEIINNNPDYYQAPLAFKGIYEKSTMGEKVDAETMHFFESVFGREYPRIYLFPRGTGTIFNFADGKNSLSDTGGFLVDYSCEDFGQGYISLIQHNSSVLGKYQSIQAPGQMTDKVFVIGEGVDINGKVKQANRWMHGASKVFFHLLIPALFKSLAKGETDLIKNKQFLSTFGFSAFGITFRFMLFLFLCLPLLLTSLTDKIDTARFIHLNILSIAIATNFLAVFFMFFYVQKRVSLSSAIRLIVIETLITVPSVVGYIKGLFGVTPKSWSADKSKKTVHGSFVGIYIILLINIFSMITIKYANYWHYFWAFFNLILLISGLVLFNVKYIPRDKKIVEVKKHFFLTWIILFIVSNALTIWFFIIESKTKLDIYKIAVMCLLAFNFYTGFRSMLINSIIVFKQKKRNIKLTRV